MLGPDNAIWDDGEWISWDEIEEQVRYHEWRAKYPNADFSLIPVFQDLLALAQEYNFATGRHLQVYGDIGELFAAITYGLKLHRNYVQGSDGRLGNDFVEVKTITPFKQTDSIEVKASGNFNKLLVVKINEDFDLSHRLIDRKTLPAPKGGMYRLTWASIAG